jgi:hypothetical protein
MRLLVLACASALLTAWALTELLGALDWDR